MKETTLEKLLESKKSVEQMINFFEENYQKESKELELIEKEIKENKSFPERSNVLEELRKKNGTLVDFVVYEKDTNKALKYCNNEPLDVSNEGMGSSVKVGHMFFPLCGNDCIKEIIDSKTGEILFKNDYYNKSYHLQRAQTFGYAEALDGIKHDKFSSFAFRNVMISDATKRHKSIEDKIKSLESDNAPKAQC